jgi:ABC-type antimicrobial peptide transport system permease subunit
MDTNLITIIAFLGILSAVLIYSLMISDVEDRTFEFGMLRALGFNTDNVVFTITMQALMFSVPGLLIGLSIAACMNVGVRYILFSLTRNVADYLLSNGAIWVGCFIGLVIPILSNIIPIRAALGKNLRSSLDLYHRSIGEMQVSVQKLGEYGLSVE